MFKLVKKKLNEQRGFTLIELLAVIVILGILAAIAIPSVLGIIDNTKKDAHVANAQQMVSAAKMAVANNSELQKTGTIYLPLEYLEKAKYLDPVTDPDNGAYALTNSATPNDTIAKALALTSAPNGSYVVVVDGVVTQVKLVNNKPRGVRTATSGAVGVSNITRDDVQ